MTDTETEVGELMTEPVETINADATVVEAARILSERGIGSLIVGADPIDGIVTEGDIVRNVAEEGDLSETTVTDIMSDPVVTIRPHESVRTAGERMGHNGVKKLPVTEDGSAVGIVTTTDLAHYLPRQRVSMSPQREPDIGKGEYE
jgi:CBS domain-containing protein